jgi:hypothetical protein
MDEISVAGFLISKQYHLSALELMAECYEHTGLTIERLSTFFQSSENFLAFEAPTTAAANAENTAASEAVRVKND